MDAIFDGSAVASVNKNRIWEPRLLPAANSCAAAAMNRYKNMTENTVMGALLLMTVCVKFARGAAIMSAQGGNSRKLNAEKTGCTASGAKMAGRAAVRTLTRLADLHLPQRCCAGGGDGCARWCVRGTSDPQEASIAMLQCLLTPGMLRALHTKELLRLSVAFVVSSNSRCLPRAVQAGASFRERDVR